MFSAQRVVLKFSYKFENSVLVIFVSNKDTKEVYSDVTFAIVRSCVKTASEIIFLARVIVFMKIAIRQLFRMR